MNKFGPIALVAVLSIASHGASMAGSMLRVTCDGDNKGANVTLNGKFKGQCPLDISVPEGMLKLLVEKWFDEAYVGIFEQEIRIGDGVIQRIDVDLVKKLTKKGRQLAQEKYKSLLEAYERDSIQYKKSIIERSASVTQCVNELKVRANDKGWDCFRNSGGCVGGFFCESYAERNTRCYGSADGTIDGSQFRASCNQKFKEPEMPVRPEAVIE